MAHLERHWELPDAGKDARLFLYNSQKDESVPFIPQAGYGSKAVTWYTCGPTVYDSSHIGHARNYVTFDILRRVLEDYFGYNILFVMNVTDVDDKIILRARRNHLFERFMQQPHTAADLLTRASASIEEAVTKQEAKVGKFTSAAAAAAGASDSRKAKDLAEQVKGEQLKLVKLKESRVAIHAARDNGQASLADVAALVKDVISEQLDEKEGASVTEKSIYRAHAAKYENEFLEDMRALGVRDPDVMPRVSDYVPQIQRYIQTIVDKKMAYEAGGSVYFSVRTFVESGHKYGVLKPWAVGSVELSSEGENNFASTAKRHPEDFALWKASKPGEPSWDSPWGPGRPGWHIECSAMADAVLGGRVDIHSGGEDLKFPHHDNEIAQSLAFLHAPSPACSSCPCQTQWVNYWLHSGHLAIDGLKMSKSLKNFITIKEALQEFSARQIRLLFCLQPWHKPMTFNQSSREEMVNKEATLKNFFQNVQVALRENSIADIDTAGSPEDTDFCARIAACQRDVHTALLDNINTAQAMTEILGLITSTNIYLAAKAAKSARPSPLLLMKATRFVSRIMTVFGLEPSADKMAFVSSVSAGDGDATAGVLNAFVAFRDQLRDFARSADGKPAREPLMDMCDGVRDAALASLGVRLEDKPGGTVWKLDDPEALKREVEDKRRQVVQKEQTKLEVMRRDREKAAAVAGCTLAQQVADRYQLGPGDEPTHAKAADGTWQEMDDKQKKAALKVVEKVKKARAPQVKRLADNPSLLAELDAAIAASEAKLAKLEAT